MLIDLDRFKEVNDTLGHGVGDRLLAQVAQRIGGCLRETDVLARLGGDEFAIVMAELADTERVGDVADSVVEAIARPFGIGDHIIHSSVSIGVALYPIDANTIDELIRNADQAMYAAKDKGRNGFHFCRILSVLKRLLHWSRLPRASRHDLQDSTRTQVPDADRRRM